MKTAAGLDTYNVRHTVCWAHNQQQKPLLHLYTVWWLFYTTFMEKALWPSYITSHNGIMSEVSTLWLCREGHVKDFQSSSQSTRIVMPPPSFLARGTWNLGQRVKPRELAFSVVSSLNQILVAFQRAFFQSKISLACHVYWNHVKVVTHSNLIFKYFPIISDYMLHFCALKMCSFTI